MKKIILLCMTLLFCTLVFAQDKDISYTKDFVEYLREFSDDEAFVVWHRGTRSDEYVFDHNQELENHIVSVFNLPGHGVFGFVFYINPKNSMELLDAQLSAYTLIPADEAKSRYISAFCLSLEDWF